MILLRKALATNHVVKRLFLFKCECSGSGLFAQLLLNLDGSGLEIIWLLRQNLEYADLMCMARIFSSPLLFTKTDLNSLRVSFGVTKSPGTVALNSIAIKRLLASMLRCDRVHEIKTYKVFGHYALDIRKYYIGLLPCSELTRGASS